MRQNDIAGPHVHITRPHQVVNPWSQTHQAPADAGGAPVAVNPAPAAPPPGRAREGREAGVFVIQIWEIPNGNILWEWVKIEDLRRPQIGMSIFSINHLHVTVGVPNFHPCRYFNLGLKPSARRISPKLITEMRISQKVCH